MNLKLKQALVIAIAAMTGVAAAETFIVEDGRPNAQIIIKNDAISPVEIAAEQLQIYIEKISGAKLPINNSVDENIPVKIYVGKSEYTDKLGIDGEQFTHGGFHIKSGADWLALVGKDELFSMPENMWPTRHGDLPRVIEEWDKATGEKFVFPYAGIWKCDSGPYMWDETTGKRTKVIRPGTEEVPFINEKDTRGSFNATTYFLRSLGVRWYLPHELGEIIPEQKTIKLPVIDKKVRPDFPIRNPHQHARRFRGTSEKEALWQWRMGWSAAPEIMGPGNQYHGIRGVTGREETREAHPEYYALYDGVRHHERQCLSSEGLLKANLRYIKAKYNIFGDSFIDVVPADAYTAICQCELCKGKDSPEKGHRGLLSNYYYDYVNRLAKELYKTHPKITIKAHPYGTYRLPPDNIDKFPPNVVLNIAQHRHDFYDAEKKKETLDARKAFIDLLPEGGKIMINEKYRSGDPMPMFYPHIIAEDLKSLKGVSLGGSFEVFRSRRNERKYPEDIWYGLEKMPDMHLNLYITSRFWWDADQDIDEVLGEYYRLFYGPAEMEMKAFIEYSEKNWVASGRDPAVIKELMSLINKAVARVDDGSIYAKRIAWIHEFIEPLDRMRKEMELYREKAPVAYFNRLAKEEYGKIKIDGKLDEDIWSEVPTYVLKEFETGKKPQFETTFKVLWDGVSESIIIGVRCEEDNTVNLNTPASRDGDHMLFEGDAVEIMFETLSHSYYQIGIDPKGLMVDLSRPRNPARGRHGIEARWSSNAEVATYIGRDFWSLEIKIPVCGDNQHMILPFDGVSGSEPTAANPWYFNIGRVRVRGDVKQVSSFNAEGFHVPFKFAKLVPCKEQGNR